MSVFGRQLEAARRMIAKYGQSVTFRTLTDGALPDPNAPWLPGTPVNVDHAVKIAFFPNSTQNNEFLHYVQGTDVPAGTEVGYLAPSGFEPTLKDLIIRSGKTLAIKSVDRIAPNGEILLYILGIGE